MPLKIIRQDITSIECDAIVNPTNKFAVPGGGTDAAIHKAAGPRLLEATSNFGELNPGEARITPGYNLRCKYIIHTVGPVWNNGDSNEDLVLESCYKNSLAFAKQKRCKSIAFPLISAGTHGYPKDRVLKVALRVIGEFLFDNEMLVYVVVYDKTSYEISEKLFADVTSYIDDFYLNEASFSLNLSQKCIEIPRQRFMGTETGGGAHKTSERSKRGLLRESCDMAAMPCEANLEEMLRKMDKGFAETLFEFIDAKGITDVECYKRANVDKKTFSKIKCNKNYKPSKVTAVSFAIALRLDLDETNRLLKTVGMSLSHSNKFDVIIEYFILSGNYKSIFDVNEVLYQFDQVMLGV